ncbi:hypothetical protein PIB30_104481 [Stylosanthes scabra]|uniref:Uncharacterized protein n=1 Tax=Stylosanthes scabra TaxID=79078 RepID=A0ABU6W1F1_9FABA|nr:hypothetical protein [Stylosanthes scabra]
MGTLQGYPENYPTSTKAPSLRGGGEEDPTGEPRSRTCLNEGPSPEGERREAPQGGLRLKKTLPQRRRPALTSRIPRPPDAEKAPHPPHGRMGDCPAAVRQSAGRSRSPGTRPPRRWRPGAWRKRSPPPPHPRSAQNTVHSTGDLLSARRVRGDRPRHRVSLGRGQPPRHQGTGRGKQHGNRLRDLRRHIHPGGVQTPDDQDGRGPGDPSTRGRGGGHGPDGLRRVSVRLGRGGGCGNGHHAASFSLFSLSISFCMVSKRRRIPGCSVPGGEHPTPDDVHAALRIVELGLHRLQGRDDPGLVRALLPGVGELGEHPSPDDVDTLLGLPDETQELVHSVCQLGLLVVCDRRSGCRGVSAVVARDERGPVDPPVRAIAPGVGLREDLEVQVGAHDVPGRPGPPLHLPPHHPIPHVQGRLVLVRAHGQERPVVDDGDDPRVRGHPAEPAADQVPAGLPRGSREVARPVGPQDRPIPDRVDRSAHRGPVVRAGVPAAEVGGQVPAGAERLRDREPGDRQGQRARGGGRHGTAASAGGAPGLGGVHPGHDFRDARVVPARARGSRPVLVPVDLERPIDALEPGDQLHEGRQVPRGHLRVALDPDGGGVAGRVAGVPGGVGRGDQARGPPRLDHEVCGRVPVGAGEVVRDGLELLPVRAPVVHGDPGDCASLPVHGGDLGGGRVVGAGPGGLIQPGGGPDLGGHASLLGVCGPSFEGALGEKRPEDHGVLRRRRRQSALDVGAEHRDVVRGRGDPGLSLLGGLPHLRPRLRDLSPLLLPLRPRRGPLSLHLRLDPLQLLLLRQELRPLGLVGLAQVRDDLRLRVPRPRPVHQGHERTGDQGDDDAGDDGGGPRSHQRSSCLPPVAWMMPVSRACRAWTHWISQMRATAAAATPRPLPQ